MKYKFSRKAGNTKIEISKNEQIISKIHFHFFYFTAEILLKGNFMQIKKKSFWQNDLVVFGNENDLPIGEIIFHNWPSRKIISLKDKGKFIMKRIDFWTRYLDPLAFKQINGPLPVEWETEVFEKYEKPYRRVGAGLTLAELYLEETQVQSEVLLGILKPMISAIETYKADSVSNHILTFDHFYLCNRLFLLNLASIYTTGFECPDTNNIIPELKLML